MALPPVLYPLASRGSSAAGRSSQEGTSTRPEQRCTPTAFARPSSRTPARRSTALGVLAAETHPDVLDWLTLDLGDEDHLARVHVELEILR